MTEAKFRTIPDMVRDRVARYGTDRRVFREKKDGRWIETDWSEFQRRVGRIALGLMNRGFSLRDRGAVYAYNRPEWLIMDFAYQFAGGATAPVYMNNTPEETAYVLKHSEAKFVLVDDLDRLNRVLDRIDELPDLQAIVTIDSLKAPEHPKVISLSRLENDGAELSGWSPKLDARIAEIDPEDPFTIVYTSGTTGVPKGAMLSHRNFLWVLQASVEIDIPRLDHEFMISYLPLAHVAQRIGDYLGVYNGATISFAESLEKFPENLKEIGPTSFVAVPRILEKVYLKVMGGAEAKGGAALKIFKWAEGLARERHAREVYGKPTRPLFDLQWRLAERLVYSKIKD
ncbi:MAG: AMP-binding protein, partial [Candidatus Methylomirabilis sp.]|nr:AMP-binding protein [Deltaproteobacteria bacterium]